MIIIPSWPMLTISLWEQLIGVWELTLYNISIGYHAIHVQSTAEPFYCIGDTDVFINSGVDNVFISVFCII